MATAPEPIVVPAERVLVITRVFDAPRDLVFRMWIDPGHAMKWWGPRHHPATQMEMDPRPGGRWRHCLTGVADGRELWQGGVFREVVAPERLVFTFAWDETGERGDETLVTVLFADEGGKTRMTLRQEPFQSVGERDGHGDGWGSTFDRLADYLAHERS
ncbi:MAG TPA: SRPBCC domain-containing protein [Xanthobacteraceae bacterium]|nr:SRPBCC domain-containing protein [Xanthobacteraceae bacterium]